MAVILNFPADRVSGRARTEKLLWDALETHEPETRDEKHKAVMEIYDRVTDKEFSITLQAPDGEPFTERQTEAITDAMRRLRDEIGKTVLGLVLEMALLKCQMIDLHNKQQ